MPYSGLLRRKLAGSSLTNTELDQRMTRKAPGSTKFDTRKSPSWARRSTVLSRPRRGYFEQVQLEGLQRGSLVQTPCQMSDRTILQTPYWRAVMRFRIRFVPAPKDPRKPTNPHYHPPNTRPRRFPNPLLIRPSLREQDTSRGEVDTLQLT